VLETPFFEALLYANPNLFFKVEKGRERRTKEVLDFRGTAGPYPGLRCIVIN
jgi:hypothetical protein